MDVHYGHGFGSDFGPLVQLSSYSSSFGRPKADICLPCVDSKSQEKEKEGKVFPLQYGISSDRDLSRDVFGAMDSFENFYNYVIHSVPRNDATKPKESDHHDNKFNHFDPDFVEAILTRNKRKQRLTQVQRIEIELKMRTSTTSCTTTTATAIGITTNESSLPTAFYKFKPSHIIFNEMCMILQTRAFDIRNKKTTNTETHLKSKTIDLNNQEEEPLQRDNHEDTVHEISLDSYDPSDEYHLLVYDIAFGLPGSCPKASNIGGQIPANHTSSSNRLRALWFHIDEKDVHECTLQDRLNYRRTAKRLERVKQIEEEKYATYSFNLGHVMEDDMEKDESIFFPRSFDVPEQLYQNGLIEEPIFMNLPIDVDSFDLVTDVLKHRLSVLKSICDEESDRGEQEFVFNYEDEELLHIQTRFQSLKAHLSTICFWPVNDGREVVDETTPVPKVDEHYSVPMPGHKEMQKFPSQRKIWKSFAYHVSLIDHFLPNIQIMYLSSTNRLILLQYRPRINSKHPRIWMV